MSLTQDQQHAHARRQLEERGFSEEQIAGLEASWRVWVDHGPHTDNSDQSKGEQSENEETQNVQPIEKIRRRSGKRPKHQDKRKEYRAGRESKAFSLPVERKVVAR